MPKLPPLEVPFLTLSQANVLQVLADAQSPLTRGRIAQFLCYPPGTIGDDLGHVNRDSRAAFEARTKRPSLLTLGLVEEVELEIDGKREVGHRLTEAGRKALTAFQTALLANL